MEPQEAPMEQIDQELLLGWQQGDTIAFERLVARWQRRLGRFLYHMVGRRESVEDLCQEVFVRLFQTGGNFRRQETWPVWLYRVARNAAIDAGRRRAVRPVTQPGDSPLTEHPDRAAPVDEDLERTETQRQVAAALARLPEPLRLVVVLRHYENLSFEEIGRMTSTPASTVKSRFSAALRELRGALAALDECALEANP
jgi:RNA polymerase sigma-70 factor (ECF subfamily)